MKAMKYLIQKELKENLLTSKGISFFLIVTLVLSVFSLLLISNTELSLLDNAQAVYMMAGIILSILSLLTIVIGSDSFAGEIDRKTMGTLLLTPFSVAQIAFVKLISILCISLVFFLISLPYLWAVASSGQNLIQTIIYVFITGFFLAFIYSGISIILSIIIKSLKGVLSIGLTVFILSVTPLFLSPSLRQHTVIGKTIDYINPFSGALNTLDSVIIDSQGISFQLIRLSILAVYLVFIIIIINIASKRIKL